VRCLAQIAVSNCNAAPPISLSTQVDLFLHGYHSVGWDVQVQDWLALPARELAGRLARHVQPGSIVLLHDALYRTQGESDIAQDRTALLDGLDAYLSRTTDLEFVSVPDLVAAGRPVYARTGW